MSEARRGSTGRSRRSRRSRLCWLVCVVAGRCGMCAGPYEISEALYFQWRERLLEGGKAALGTARDKKPPEAAGPQTRAESTGTTTAITWRMDVLQPLILRSAADSQALTGGYLERRALA
jgi:hypothetical protein